MIAFLTNDIGFQYTCIALAVAHGLMFTDILIEKWLKHRFSAIVISPLRSRAVNHFLYVGFWLMITVINGAHPRIERSTMMPYSRTMAFLIMLSIFVVVGIKTYRIFNAIRRSRNAHD